MNIEDFLQDYTVPPPVGKGEKAKFTVTLTQDEYDRVQRLAYNPVLEHVYNRNLYEVMRHALHFFLYRLEGELVTGWVDPIRELRMKARTFNLDLRREAIFSLLDEKAHQCNLLMDYGEITGALDEFERLLHDVAELPSYWRTLLIRFINEHPEMARFEGRMHLEHSHEMQMIWEAMPE